MPSRPDQPPRSLPWLLVGGGAVGLTAAAVLLVEKLRLYEDPTYVPSCSINPILSCGSVMRTDQAEAFGFPNPTLGLVGFSVVVTVGVALLAGTDLRRWFWTGLAGGVTAGALFVHWLMFQSLYRIGALCPYCMAVWVVTIAIAWYTWLHVLRTGPRTAHRAVVRFAAEYHAVGLTIWYLAIGALITRRFWDYWSGLLA